MNWTVEVLRTFTRDLANLPLSVRQAVKEFAFQILPTTDNPYALGRVEKLKGYRDYYKARFGEYRVGLRIQKDRRRIELRCVKHRRDIYRHFP